MREFGIFIGIRIPDAQNPLRLNALRDDPAASPGARYEACDNSKQSCRALNMVELPETEGKSVFDGEPVQIEQHYVHPELAWLNPD